MKLLPFISGAILLGLSSIVHAAPITFAFSGEVTDIPADDPGGGIIVGTLFSGQFTFDSAVADGIPSASQGSYLSSGAGFGLSVQIGSNSYDLPGFLNIGISNDLLGMDQYLPYASAGDLSVSISLEDLTGTVFVSDALPLAVPPIGSFSVRRFQLYDNSTGSVEIQGVLTSLSCRTGCGGNNGGGGQVPEPAALALLGLSLLAGIGYHRSKIALSHKQ